jgi:hypothetical protein
MGCVGDSKGLFPLCEPTAGRAIFHGKTKFSGKVAYSHILRIISLELRMDELSHMPGTLKNLLTCQCVVVSERV